MIPPWAAPLLWAAGGLIFCGATVAVPALVRRLRQR